MQIKNQLLNISIFITFSLFVSFGRGYGLYFLLSLTSLILLKDSWPKKFNIDQKLIIFSILLFFLSHLMQIVLHGDKASVIDTSWRTIFIISIILVIVKFRPSVTLLFSSLISSAFFAALSGFLLIYLANHFNKGWARLYSFDSAEHPNLPHIIKQFFQDWMPIQTGGFLASLFLFLTVFIIYFLKKRKFYSTVFCIIINAFLMFLLIKAQARGAWISLLPIILLIVFLSLNTNSRKKCYIASAIIITFLCLFFFNQTTNYEIKRTISSISPSKTDTENHYSTYERIQLWKSAIYSFHGAPLLGYGYKGQSKIRMEQNKEKIVNIDKNFIVGHAHNQYLQALQTRGLIGLLSLFMFFLSPLYIFIKNFKASTNDINSRTVNILGMTLVLSVMIFSLTQSYIHHMSGILFYSCFVSVFLGYSLYLNNLQNKAENL